MAQVQEGIENSLVDYYDIMVIGMTGQGKSTTADKLLIANPTQEDYSHLQYQEQHNVETGQLQVDDISMWLISKNSKLEEEKTRLKFLSYCRSKQNPHELVNDRRDHDPCEGSESEIFASTKECEVISNDTSKIRVLDVPGFFDGDDLTKSQDSASPTKEYEKSTRSVFENNLGIMRKILHTQTALRMKFKRILYFLPVRGPLVRANAILKLDLQLLKYYFGKSVLGCIVIVATIPAEISCLPNMDDSQKFSEKSRKRTNFLFQKALDDVFQQPDLPVPPIIFISLTDSCEDILQKVREAPVSCDNLELKFDPSICVDCGMKVGEVKGEKVAVCFGEDWSAAIPYNESTCHPVLIPKYSRFDRFKGGVVYVVTFGWARGKKWPVFEGEVCAGCHEEPGKPGCMQVGKPFKPRKGDGITVDHSNQMTNVVAKDGTQAGTGNDMQEDPEVRSDLVCDQTNPHFHGQIEQTPSVGNPSPMADTTVPSYQNIQHEEPSRQPIDTQNCFEDRKG